jgi:hypothetical protein
LLGRMRAVPLMFRPALLVASLCVATAALAQPVNFDQALEAREVAMGGAYRALGTTAVGIDGNPAAVGLFKFFQVDVGGAYDVGNKTWYVGGFVRDSQTSVLAAGYSFQLLSQPVTTAGVTTNVTGFQQVFAFALPLADYMTAGVSTHWVTESDLRINAASLDVGAAFKIGTVATLGFAGHNLINTNHPVELGRYFDLSTGLHFGPVQLALDALSNFGPHQFHPKLLFGTEVAIGKTFLIRAGVDFYTRTNVLAPQWYLTAGVGFSIDKGGLDFGYRQSLTGVGNLMVATLRIVL